ncbi:MAG: FYDLN acid domain-containing protein [Pseudomonadota bacterium]|nr:FYDLN acid domain-containing protein [Pseudomonadota bacterium]
MEKLELGNKLTCQSCGAKYYDLKKKKPVCPTCEAEYAPAKPKVRRAAPEPSKPVPAAAENDTTAKGDAIEVEINNAVLDTGDDDAGDDGLMEDTSDIGGGEDEVAVVIDKIDGDGSDKN